jgi:hypothetical protein
MRAVRVPSIRGREAHPPRQRADGFGVSLRAVFDPGDLFHHVDELPLFVVREMLVKKVGE